MQANRESVITGVGVVTPIGIGRGPFWDALLARRSGVRLVDVDVIGSLRPSFAGTLEDFHPKTYIRQRKSLKLMCQDVASGVAAAALAVEDAGLTDHAVDPDRYGVLFGSEMLYAPPVEMHDLFRASCQKDGQFDIHEYGRRMTTDLFPLWMLKYLPNMAACHVGIEQQACGPNNTIVQGDASSMLALAEAVTVIQRGWADVIICGGCGNQITPTRGVYLDDRMFNWQESEPALACRPFDALRNGWVPGEGAGAIIVESAEHAAARQATVLARIAGFGRAFEPRKDFQPYAGTAIRRTMQQALQQAQMKASDIGHVNAHGMSTQLDDAIEAAAIADVLGDTPVTALKSYFGNLGAGSGMVELVGSLLGIQQDEIPVTLNYEQPDPACPIHVIRDQPLAGTRPSVMALSHSSTGQSVAVVMTK